MHTTWRYLPGVLVLACALIMLFHGAIPQYEHYHAFADSTLYWHIPNAMDVLSNLTFAFTGLFGMLASYWHFILRGHKWQPTDIAYLMFVLCIFATSFGSAFYHWAPDDSRLFWDRLPIALACASLMVAVRSESRQIRSAYLVIRDLMACLLFATASVFWWQETGDLRPYLALQLLAIVLIPVWQTIYKVAARTRWIYAIAIGLYVLAKITEMYDDAIFMQTGFISGHTIKHLCASGAAAVIIGSWLKRAK